jgi:sulfite reductase beta subunit-like hemoprotein
MSGSGRNGGQKRDSNVELAKLGGDHLRGGIDDTLRSDATHFASDDVQLLKFHGIYQQDDRDTRKPRQSQGFGRDHRFMVRVSLPGGTLTADQYLAFDDLADAYANGTLRVTTRQGLQFHGVVKGDLKATIAGVNAHLATTLAACGDVARNVMACPAPLDDPEHHAVRTAAAAIARELRPAGHAYYEIWQDRERLVSSEPEEPFYGDRYLPRKFKIAVGLASDNCVDLYAQDVGLVAVTAHGRVRGFDVLVGGGLGMTHGKGDTIARLGEPLGFVEAEHAVEAARIIAAVFRDHGNRGDRRHARLKYLVNEWGIERFRAEFARRAPFALQPFEPLPRPRFQDHLGRQQQDDGRWFYGVFVQSGRIQDAEPARLRTALRTIVDRHRPGLAFTPHQNVLLTGLDFEVVEEIERTLEANGVTPAPSLPAVRRFSMACPALPTCGLAVAESERLLPSVLDELDRELARLGLSEEPLTVRMTGCPNGCARPYTADIAFVGRSLNLYNVYVGGGLAGDRVVDLYRADVRTPDLVAAVRPLLVLWADDRRTGEGLGDFYQRAVGRTSPRTAVTGKEEATAELIQLGAAR